MGNLQYRSIIRFLAGGYLIYMGYSLFRQLMSEGGVDNPWLIGLFAGGFILFGIGLVLFEMRLIKREQAEETSDKETVIEEIVSEKKEEPDEET